MKRVAQSLLLALAASGIVYWAWGRFTVSAGHDGLAVAVESTPDRTHAVPSRTATRVVMVTYFTTNVRCESCRTIEKLARSAVEESFAPELAEGRVRFQTLNLDEPQNAHFATDYGLSFKSVVVSEELSEKVVRWRKLDDVWTLLSEPESFKRYIAGPVRAFLTPEA